MKAMEVFKLAKGIKCVVEECVYNQDKLCQADSIEVRSSGDMAVATSDGTACETFKPQEIDQLQ